MKQDVIRQIPHCFRIFSLMQLRKTGSSCKRFSFICLLSFDVYMKKMMIEHLIDGMNPPAEHNGKKKKES